MNPRRRPASQADVAKAKQQAVDEAVSFAWAIMLTVLRDKEGYGTRVRLPRFWGRVQELCEGVQQGYVSVADLKHELRKAGIELQ